MNSSQKNRIDGMPSDRESEFSATGVASAPPPDSDRALELEERSETAKPGSPAHSGQKQQPPERTDDLSQRKYRFMTALLDKLKANGRPNTGVPANAGSPDEKAATPNNGPIVTSVADADDAPHSGSLDDTQASDAGGSRPMTFTYPPGSTPLPRYTIRRGIGIGGFGEVYFAVSDAGKEVALKRIQRNLEVELRGVSHCLNLKHPNLVALFDICQDANEQSWVVMEYVAGPNLRQVLDESPDGLPAEEVRRWFTAIAAGVSHLHSAGLVHRDLKPGNVFDDLGIIKVGDYGLSKFISASHRGGHTESVGTFHYMAPEIGRGQYGREIDIYALGIVLYELITGHVPFDGESCHEIIVKHLTATPELGAITEPYRSTIAKCLEKDPNRRFSTVDEMMQSLAFEASGGPILVADLVDPAEADHQNDSATADSQPSHEEPVVATLASQQPVLATHANRPTHANRNGERCIRTGRHPASTDEPFARAVRHSIDDLKRWWETLDRSPGAKAFMMVVAAFVLVINTHWLLPLLSVVALFYVPYYIVRQMVLHVRQQPTYAEAQRIATAAGHPRKMISRAQWRNHMRTDLRAKRSIHRLAELNTSWIAATLTALGMALAAGVIGLRNSSVDAMAIAPYGWMAVVVLVASLGLLGLGKLWERDEGEGLPRRLVLAGVGAGVGVAAYALSEFLLLPMDATTAREVNAIGLPQSLYDANGQPLAAAMMAHFALLFAGLRWWKAVDPLRRTRLSLWSVAVAVVAEWAVHQILPIPQPAGMLMAGGISIAIQMSAPWINPREMPGRITDPESLPNDEPAVASRSLA